MRPPPSRFAPLKRWVARVVGRGRGEVRALQDLNALRGSVRFMAIFGAAVLVPALILAYFALTSIRAEELYVDADVARRATAVSDQINRDLHDDFAGLERGVTERLARGQSPLAGLEELSPYLRVAFRFDNNGSLVAPFTIDTSDPRSVVTERYAEAERYARQLENAGRYIEAAAAWRAAMLATHDAGLAGDAAFGHARSLWRAGQVDAAEQAFIDVYAYYANVRDPYGFSIGQKATLLRARAAFERDPEVGVVAMRDFVDGILDDDERWVIGRPGDAAIARAALALLDGHTDAEWLGRARNRLNERSTQHWWAEQLADQLELVFSSAAEAPSRDPDGVFNYIQQHESGTLWATTWWRGELYAFALDYDAIVAALARSAMQATATDPEVRVTLTGPAEAAPPATIVRLSLTPWLPYVTVAIGPADPDLIADTKAQKRRTRIVVIVVAVAMATLGVGFAGRMLRRELEGARIKADFAANVSHELRSPITQIRLKGEALQLGLVDDEPDRQQHYDAIVREAERLSRLVDNVLDFAAIERGAKKYTFRPEDLHDVIAGAVDAARAAFEGRGVTIDVDVPDDLPVVWCDREAISQVLTNLLSNAAKYGADGKWVGVRARVGPDGVAVAVADRGLGISKDEQARIFDRFYRSADPRIRKHRGTGIGLTIVRYIVEEHGGTIAVDSEPGHGTTFTINLPLEAREGAGA